MVHNHYPPPAGFWIRVGAAFIDGLILLPLSILIVFDMLWWKSYFLIVILTIPNLIYKPFMESYKGATLGKMALNIRVINEQGNNLTLAQAYMRILPQIMAACVGLLSYAVLFSTVEFREATTLLQFIQFRQENPFTTISTLSGIFVFVDCCCAGLTFRKRALHDMMAHSYCILTNRTMPAISAIPPISGTEDVVTVCEKCGKEIAADATICPHCGALFNE